MPGFAVDNRVYLTNRQSVDGLFNMVMELAKEHWVLRDRLAVIEHLLDVGGTLTRADIEAFQPSGDLARELDEQRADFLTRIVSSWPLDGQDEPENT